ncbi:MerR family transcriptional regulator [Streptomyces sp. GS7]|uniref:MerR family transcriptional regulator n=1 Tax=Streptomyces sp. GS7 TaxID=2692234 RepID=UPI0013163EBE|nr:MerR family transcriptional regulator [Streptomyces sp. GS7]QHC26532.1 MerR family transcriptional regulator [Streptomyces sp. GS7]
MDDTGELLSIGAFGRRVGLAPSALRFYDDCGVLRPARVDAATGYRRYAGGQIARAVRLRQLRAAGLPLTDVEVVLDGPDDAARGVLWAHLERTRRAADEARAVVERFLQEAPGEPVDRGDRVRARVGGPELASAVRQVVPAAAAGAAREQFPVLGCLLLELADGEARLVATDRYRMAVRVLRPEVFEGGARRVLITAEAAQRLAEWAVRQVAVEMECGPGADTRAAVSLRMRSGGERGDIAQWAHGCGTNGVADPGEFPDYRLMVAGLEAGRHRLVVDRAGLRDAVAGRSGVVSLTSGMGAADTDVGVQSEGAQVLEVAGGDREPVRLRVVRTGPGMRIAFDSAMFVPVLEAGVGPDVLLEIAAADRPVVVRSADQGSFTTLVMPVRAGTRG